MVQMRSSPSWLELLALWETVRMANERDRVPKEGDRVRTPNLKDEFVVVAVRENPNVVDLDLPNGPLRIKNIPHDAFHLFSRSNGVAPKVSKRRPMMEARRKIEPANRQSIFDFSGTVTKCYSALP